jgi:SlyX protein
MDPNGMIEDRIIELEIKQAYQEDLIQSLNQVVIDQQVQLRKIEETCRLLNEKIKSFAGNQVAVSSPADERPPHY